MNSDADSTDKSNAGSGSSDLAASGQSNRQNSTQFKSVIVRSFEIAKQQGLVLALILLVVIFSITSPQFFSFYNIFLVLRQISIWGVIACGMTFVIVGGNWDLSVGSLTSLTTVIVISLHDKVGTIPAMAAALLVGLASGLVSGYLVGYQGLNSLITTLGMLGVLQALTLFYTGGAYTQIAHPSATWFKFIGRGYIFHIPFPVIVLAVIAVAGYIVLTRTSYGRKVRALGGNPTASKYSGVRVKLLVMGTFVMTGVLTAVGGIMLGSRMMAAQNFIGQGYEFQVITGVILGGTSLSGGEGNVLKSVIGIVIIGILSNWFILIGLQYYFQWVALWVIILGVVWVDVVGRQTRGRA